MSTLILAQAFACAFPKSSFHNLAQTSACAFFKTSCKSFAQASACAILIALYGIDAGGMAYSKTTPLPVEGIKALLAEIEKLKAENITLNKRITELEDRMEKVTSDKKEKPVGI